MGSPASICDSQTSGNQVGSHGKAFYRTGRWESAWNQEVAGRLALERARKYKEGLSGVAAPLNPHPLYLNRRR